jgi:uncharacterized protein YbaP (TraB family)
VANGQGRFWQVSREGGAPSFLFGTFHSAEAIDTLTPAIWAAFDGASRVVVELDLDQKAAMEARLATDPAFAFDVSAPPLSSRLTAEQRAELVKALEIRGMELEMVEQMRPWLLASILGFPACHIAAMAEGAEALDIDLAERAIARGTALNGLETYQDAIGAFQRVDSDLLLASIASTSGMVASEEDVFRTNSLLYAKGEIALIGELGILLGDLEDPDRDNRMLHDALMSELLDHRNRAWMTSLPGFLEAGNVFVAVGALHLPGETGLIELLRAEGYSVTRLPE